MTRTPRVLSGACLMAVAWLIPAMQGEAQTPAVEALPNVSDSSRYQVQARYWNWTTKLADHFCLELAQVVFSGEDVPAQPVLTAEGFPNTTISERNTEDILNEPSLTIKRSLRQTKYCFRGCTTPPGGSVDISVGGEFNVAEGVMLAWIDEQGKEIDSTKTKSLASRAWRAPLGADGLHVEFKQDIVAGVWLPKGTAQPTITVSPGEEYPYKIRFLELQPSFEFYVDFATENPSLPNPRAGTRPGRFWWTQNGERLGEIIESG